MRNFFGVHAHHYAGLSTGIGALIVPMVKSQSKSILSIGLGFSAGVMRYVSFMEILPFSIFELSKSLRQKKPKRRR